MSDRDAYWDIYQDTAADKEISKGTPQGQAALAALGMRLRREGPRMADALPYPPPFPRTLHRALIRFDGIIYGAVEYAEEAHRVIRITWVSWLPGR